MNVRHIQGLGNIGYAPDVCSNTSLLTLLNSSVYRNQDSRVRGGLLRVEVLDQRRVGVEIRSRRVPVIYQFSEPTNRHIV